MATDLERLIVYITPETKERFAELARIEHRAMSKHAAYLIEKAIQEAEEAGILPAEDRTGRDREKGK